MGWWTTKLQGMAESLAARHHFKWELVSGCCRIEMENVSLATYDWQRLGVDSVALHPSQADLLFIGGWINSQRADEIKSVFSQMRKPTSVIALGACALSGSPYFTGTTELQDHMRMVQDNTGAGSRIIKASDLVPIDIYVAGCPPRPEAILDAILELQRKLKPGPSVDKVLHEAFRSH